MNEPSGVKSLVSSVQSIVLSSSVISSSVSSVISVQSSVVNSPVSSVLSTHSVVLDSSAETSSVHPEDESISIGVVSAESVLNDDVTDTLKLVTFSVCMLDVCQLLLLLSDDENTVEAEDGVTVHLPNAAFRQLGLWSSALSRF